MKNLVLQHTKRLMIENKRVDIQGAFFVDAAGNIKPERRVVPRTSTGAIILPSPGKHLAV